MLRNATFQNVSLQTTGWTDTRSSLARVHFEVAIFEALGDPDRIIPAFFLLVLSVSGTHTRTQRYRIEYKYHFLEYE
jgi:hypothetical protein